jgi:hypothetical protein
MVEGLSAVIVRPWLVPAPDGRDVCHERTHRDDAGSVEIDVG